MRFWNRPGGRWLAIGGWALGAASLSIGCSSSSDGSANGGGLCPEEICPLDGASGGATSGGNVGGSGGADGADVWQRDPLCGAETACDPDWNTCGEGADTSDADASDDAEMLEAESTADASADGYALDGTSRADGAPANVPDTGSTDARSDALADGSEDTRNIDARASGGDADVEASDADRRADTLGSLAIADAGEAAVSTPEAGSDASAAPSDAAAATDARERIPARACHIRRGPAGGPTPVCELAGPVVEGGACTSSTDCRPGLACVDDVSVSTAAAEASISSDSMGVCRPFCCGGSCQTEAACTPRGLHDGTAEAGAPGAGPLMVPVCVPVPTCRLLDPTSCPARTTCAPRGTAQTTYCVEIGSAQPNDPCDDQTHCAAGLVCVKSIGRCLPLCHTADAGSECQKGTCQGQSDSLPDGFGLCIADTDQPDGY